MTAVRYIVDATSVTRVIRKRYIIDAGGVTRFVRKRYVIDAGGTGRLTYVAFTGRIDTFATAGTFADTVPYGATTMLVEAWGPAGAGGAGAGSGSDAAGGGGGGSGAYSRSLYNVANNNGETIGVTITSAASGAPTEVTAGTFGITTMIAPSGEGGGEAGGTGPDFFAGPGGPGGTLASGGNQANEAGNAGIQGATRTTTGSGGGGAGIAGVNGTGANGGVGSATAGGMPGAATPGVVIIQFSP